MFKTDFLCRMENQAILFNHLVAEADARKALRSRQLTPDQIWEISSIMLDCADVIQRASSYPDAGEA